MRKFSQLSWRDRLLLVNAFSWLAIARIVIAIIPFRHIGTLAARQPCPPSPPIHAQLIEIRRIRWAVQTMSCYVPWRAKCFEQGIAAQSMLRRRGVPSVIFYGAAQVDKSRLTAHVWVRAGELDVIGGETAHRFSILATFPPQGE